MNREFRNEKKVHFWSVGSGNFSFFFREIDGWCENDDYKRSAGILVCSIAKAKLSLNEVPISNCIGIVTRPATITSTK